MGVLLFAVLDRLAIVQPQSGRMLMNERQHPSGAIYLCYSKALPLLSFHPEGPGVQNRSDLFLQRQLFFPSSSISSPHFFSGGKVPLADQATQSPPPPPAPISYRANQTNYQKRGAAVKQSALSALQNQLSSPGLYIHTNQRYL